MGEFTRLQSAVTAWDQRMVKVRDKKKLKNECRPDV